MPFRELPTGATLYYDDLYTGPDANPPVLLLIHGWLGTAQADFAELLPWLTRQFRVIGPTRRGYGESSPKPRDYPVDFLRRDARDMIALMDALAVERFHVLGWSDGGETGLCVAGLAADRVLSCAVWGAVGYYAPSIQEAAENVYPLTWMDAETKARNHLTDSAADELVAGWVAAVRAIAAAGGDVAVSLAGDITAPVLMMLGVQDRLNSPGSAQHFLAGVRDGGLVMFDCGHDIHRDEPDRFRRVLAAFWDGTRA